MISLLDIHYLYAEPGIREIHLIGQFLDAFLRPEKVFIKPGTGKRVWS